MSTWVLISGGESNPPNKALNTIAHDRSPSMDLGSFPHCTHIKNTKKGINKKNRRRRKNLRKKKR